jgi:hypothetical protein
LGHIYITGVWLESSGLTDGLCPEFFCHSLPAEASQAARPLPHNGLHNELVACAPARLRLVAPTPVQSLCPLTHCCIRTRRQVLACVDKEYTESIHVCQHSTPGGLKPSTAK